jgi:hypothetical protein
VSHFFKILSAVSPFNYSLSLFHLNNFFIYFFILSLFNLFTKNLHVHEIKILLCERDERWGKKIREKRKKKCADHVREKCETKLVSEYYSSEFVSNFTHQNFLV